MPAVEVDIIPWFEPAPRFFFQGADAVAPLVKFELGPPGKNLLLHGTQLMLLAGVEYFQAVSPRELPFHDIDRIFVFVVNVIAVKPGKCTLFE